MFKKSDEFKSALSAIRERVAVAKKRGTHGGFIDYHGCMSVTHDFVDILEDAGKAADRGDYAFAYSVAALILINLSKLASTADDSGGGITDARRYNSDVLEKICSGVAYGSEEAEYIFTRSITDSQNSAFDGWKEFAYDLLLKTARLAVKTNADKMFAAADELYKQTKAGSYTDWAAEYDALVRLEIIKTISCDDDVSAFINANLCYPAIRRVAVNNAISAGNYILAEKLCLENLNPAEVKSCYTRPSEWLYFLFEIYEKSGQTERTIQTAKELLFRFDTKYYGKLKRLLMDKGTWDAEYPSLLETLRRRLPYNLYMGILAKEAETERLLLEARAHPESVFTYGKQLSAEFPNETYSLCVDVIREQAAEANSRIKYKKVCGLIKKLRKFGGVSEAVNIIAELKRQYQRRPALLDELNALDV